MADIVKRFAKGTISTANSYQTVYTVPAGKMALIKAVTFCMTANTTKVTFAVAGTSLISTYELKGSETITIPFLDQVMMPGENIQISSSVTGLNYYISGREVDA